MNYLRIVLSAVAATVVYFAFGFLMSVMPIPNYYGQYSGVYRHVDAIMSHMPIGFAGIFLAMLALATIYAMNYEAGSRSGVANGAILGLLIGVFVAGAFAAHEYVILNIGGNLALEEAIAALAEWTCAGAVIGLIYKT